jgi:hypothetical protein
MEEEIMAGPPPARPPESRPGFFARRIALADEHARIKLVEKEARALVEELWCRRDGCTPRKIDIPTLITAIEEISK